MVFQKGPTIFPKLGTMTHGLCNNPDHDVVCFSPSFAVLPKSRAYRKAVETWFL